MNAQFVGEVAGIVAAEDQAGQLALVPTKAGTSCYSRQSAARIPIPPRSRRNKRLKVRGPALDTVISSVRNIRRRRRVALGRRLLASRGLLLVILALLGPVVVRRRTARIGVLGRLVVGFGLRLRLLATTLEDHVVAASLDVGLSRIGEVGTVQGRVEVLGLGGDGRGAILDSVLVLEELLVVGEAHPLDCALADVRRAAAALGAGAGGVVVALLLLLPSMILWRPNPLATIAFLLLLPPLEELDRLALEFLWIVLGADFGARARVRMLAVEERPVVVVCGGLTVDDRVDVRGGNPV